MPQQTTPDDFRALTQRAGLDLTDDSGDANIVDSSLDHLIGTWTQAEADELDAALKHFEMVDEAVWQ